ncbi:NAD(P)/FAD-dependent oxidoreductase [Chitinasiproducens palmae]|uniref:3-phenylpropionate/trans-cinnamate dioxygenase ferredoxin reductase subunit n=1 Tax=Chitinasiproducens palmae TaxID=1770053 RepID=A0A1H2PL24_9BURK|nr:FAD-dependent oxidoreductase [Chitinasiproducens palmae]SDV46318.1 3-phenylpropionate/trans-cinnamate dioxygenase ferredoxin reductase subunit [Chitinasiproducens palmae]
MEDTILIVGAGQAGGQAAHALRDNGFNGRIVMVGDEAWRPYERPPLSKEALLAADDSDCFKGWLHPEQFYDDAAVEHLEDSVTRLDIQTRTAQLGSGATLHYDKCLIATGGRARSADGARCGARVVSLRTLDDAMRIRGLMARARSVAVIGGGFLGLEFAASARARGLAVTVFERGARLLARALPVPIADQLRAKHEQHGVRIVFDAGVVEVNERDADVLLTRAGDATAFDFCVVAVGQVPNDEIARVSGIDVDDGIVVDRFCRTSALEVYAAGDCARFPLGDDAIHTRLESWQNAQQQAITAARNMLGAPCAYQLTPWFWTDQYDWNLQMLGMLTDDIDRWVARDGSDRKAMRIGLRGNVIKYALAINQGGELRALRRLIEQAIPVDADALADTAIKLRQLDKLAR